LIEQQPILLAMDSSEIVWPKISASLSNTKFRWRNFGRLFIGFLPQPHDRYNAPLSQRYGQTLLGFYDSASSTIKGVYFAKARSADQNSPMNKAQSWLIRYPGNGNGVIHEEFAKHDQAKLGFDSSVTASDTAFLITSIFGQQVGAYIFDETKASSYQNM
jgi:hypothetical protein